jgi:hypothetical protein
MTNSKFTGGNNFQVRSSQAEFVQIARLIRGGNAKL